MENTDKYTDTTRVYVKGAVLQNAIRNNNITQSDLCKMMNIREGIPTNLLRYDVVEIQL